MTPNQLKSPNPGDGDDSAGAVGQFCRRVVECLELELEVDWTQEGRGVQVNFKGPDRPFLLSNSAALLNCLEFLLNRIFRMAKEDAPGIILDSENYRQHREAELVLLAQMASKKVVALRKPLSLQPMTPRERRIVHLALAGIEGVRTQSEGEGDDRSITIYPS